MPPQLSRRLTRCDVRGTATSARITPNIVFESGQFSSLLGMVAAGIGISLVPEMAVDRNADCRFIRLSDPRATRTIVAAILRGRSFNRVQQAFVSGIVAKARTAAKTQRPSRLKPPARRPRATGLP